jgi:hypothetical protein
MATEFGFIWEKPVSWQKRKSLERAKNRLAQETRREKCEQEIIVFSY